MADLDGADVIDAAHVAEAVQYRSLTGNTGRGKGRQGGIMKKITGPAGEVVSAGPVCFRANGSPGLRQSQGEAQFMYAVPGKGEVPDRDRAALKSSVEFRLDLLPQAAPGEGGHLVLDIGAVIRGECPGYRFSISAQPSVMMVAWNR